MYSPRLRSGEPGSPLRGMCLHKPLGIFLHWSLSLLPHLFYLITQLNMSLIVELFIYLSTGSEYLFYTLGNNPIQLYLFSCSDCSSFGHWSSFSWPVYLFGILPSIFFKHFFAFWHYKMLQLHLVLFPASCPRSSHLSMEP